MPGPVVVEVTAASPEAAQITAMVEACGRAVGHTSCVLARQAPEPPYEAVAIVTWLGDNRVRVETALRSGEHSDWRSRELVFQPSDQELERAPIAVLAAAQGRLDTDAVVTEPRDDGHRLVG
ncbi:MAG TPA: hypothetical protein VM686_40550, partial [Polyangiaceae bacterium]|nr:hypothetical protein [Polyangiaceae bacterium]